MANDKVNVHGLAALEEMALRMRQMDHHQLLETEIELKNIISRIRSRITRFAADADTTIKKGGVDKQRPHDVQAKPRILIGHGGSATWRELATFLRERLGLEWTEFERDSAAGHTISERLESMLSQSSLAFLVMTAEDEHKDGTLHARDNVIHEIGLCQGHFGRRRSVVLLEDGCAEFSNIHGLIQIRFKRGELLAKSEDIRRVLEREGLVPNNQPAT